MLFLSPSANLLSMALVPTHGMGTGLSVFCSPTESTSAPRETSNGFHWRGVLQTVISSWLFSMLLYLFNLFLYFNLFLIFGDRINDPSNEYLKLPFFFSLIGKIKVFSKSCVPLFCEVTTWFLSLVLPGCIHHAQCLFSAPGIQLQSVFSTLKKDPSLVPVLLSSGQQGLQ